MADENESVSEAQSPFQRFVDIVFSKYVLGAAVGAFFTAFGGSLYNRAKPEVAVFDVSVTSEIPSDFAPDKLVPIPIDLRDEVAAHDWLNSFQKESMRSIELNEVLLEMESTLEETLLEKEKFLSDLPILERILKKAETEESDIQQFFDVWQRNDGFIHAAVRGDFHRGDFLIPSASLTGGRFEKFSEPAEPLYATERRLTFNDGTVTTVCSVSSRGGKFISTLVPARQFVVGPDDEDLGRFVCNALVSFDTSQLSSLVSVSKESARDSETDRALLARIVAFRKGVGRIRLITVLTNTGRDPIIFSDRVNVSASAAGVPGMPSPLQFSFRRVDDAGRPLPTSLKGGESVSVVFFSEDHLQAYSSNPSRLIQMVEEDERDATLTISVRPMLHFSWSYPFINRSETELTFPMKL